MVIQIKNYINKFKLIRITGIATSVAFLLLVFLSVFPIIGYQEQAEATPITSTSTITITSASSIASVDIAPISSTGTFASSDSNSSVAFGVSTDNLTGYQLSIIGNDATGELTNTSHGDTIASISSPVDATTFATGDTETYVNKWGILPSKLNSTANTDFLAAPTTNTNIIIDITSSPNTIANNYTIGLGARVDYTKPVGTYTNTYVLQAVGNQISYEINYLDNSGIGGATGTDVSNLPASEGSSSIAAAYFTLSDITPTRTDYTFNGWCLGIVSHTDLGNSTCNGTVYSAGQNFNFTNPSATNVNIANLYAMWNVKYYCTSSDANCMQYYTKSTCSQKASSSDVTLIDSRDGNTYTVRYINGNCWMTSNLLFQGTTLQSSTSNVTTTRYINGSSVKAYYSLATDASISSTHCYGVDANGTGNGYTYACSYYTASDSNIGNKPNAWYNFAAASAGTVTGPTNSGTASEDICPKNWKMPNKAQLSSVTSYASIFKPVGGGRYMNGNLLFNSPSSSYYYSNETSSDRVNWYMYYVADSETLAINNGTVSRYQGTYIRCLAQ